MGQWPTLVTDEFAKTYWLFQNGQSVPAIFGAEEDDDTDDKDDDDDAKKTGDDDKSEDDDDDDDDDDDEKDDDDKKSSTRPERQAAKYRTELRAAQKELEDLRKAKRDREDSEKTDLQRAQDRVKELEKDVSTKDAELKDHRIQLAFFGVNEVDWVDSSDALAALDLSDVEIDEDGKINKKQLRKAIKALAADKPHWVKSENDSSSGASGSKMNGRRKGDQENKPDRAALEKDFPALKNRSV
jgi:hypothetical protein